MDLFALVIEGVLFGLFLAVMVGPIMITIIEACMSSGKRAGWAVAVGIWVSDILIVGAVYAGLLKLSDRVWGFPLEDLLRYGGGLVFLAVGTGILLKKPNHKEQKIDTTLIKQGKFFTQGFLINTINPFTFIFWISVVGSRVISRSLDRTEAWTLLGTILLMIVLTDSTKVFLSDVIRKHLKTGILLWVQRVAGAFLLLTGLYILFLFHL